MVLINGRESEAKTSRNVAESFLSKQKKKFYVKVLHSIELPIGYGLGLSGAGALSLSMALNEALLIELVKTIAPEKKIQQEKAGNDDEENDGKNLSGNTDPITEIAWLFIFRRAHVFF